MKNKCTQKGKLPQEKPEENAIEEPEENTLEREIEDMIDREKTKGRIVSKLFNQTIPPTVKSDH
ncbi:MAG: hypothetical protein ACOYMF_15935 [Bacteroidales bacterium]